MQFQYDSGTNLGWNMALRLQHRSLDTLPAGSIPYVRRCNRHMPWPTHPW